MTLPVPILPGAVYFVTRRTHGGRFRLRPDPQVRQLVEYCVAVAARRYDVPVFAFVCMSNHWHALLLDRHGIHRQFVQYVDALLARALNARQGQQDGFWSSRRNNPLLIPDRDTFLRYILYLQANPVAAGLVRHARQWPGFITLPGDLGTVRAPVTRPRFFFREGGPLPAEARLRLHKPAVFGLENLSGEEIRALAQEQLDEREEELAAERRLEKKGVLGRVAIWSTDPQETPSTPLPRGQLSPKVATRDAPLWRLLIAWFQGFLEDYRAAREEYLAGDREVRFPFGTNALHLFHGVRCRNGPGALPLELAT